MLTALDGISQSLNAYLVLAGILFAIGSFGFLARRNAISMLMSIELMLNAVNLTIIAFGAFIAALKVQGSVIALIVMAVAAAEATVGLSIVIAIYRNKKKPLVDEYDTTVVVPPGWSALGVMSMPRFAKAGFPAPSAE